MMFNSMIVEAEFKGTTDFLNVSPGDIGRINFWITQDSRNPKMIAI